MKFEYINLLNEDNDDNSIYLPKSITYEGYLKRFVRDKEKLGLLSGTHFVRDCRSRVVNYTKRAKFYEDNVNDKGEVMAVKSSYALGHDFAYIVGEILRYFCTFNSGNKNKNYQFILKTLKVNDDRTISISDRDIKQKITDEETSIEDLNESDLFFVFDAKCQYRYGEGGLKIHAYPSQLIKEKGGRHASNLLLTNDANLERYKLCSLSDLLNHINSKINKEFTYADDKKKITKDNFINALNSNNRTDSSKLIENFTKTFDGLNFDGALIILSDAYEKISWGDFDFLNNEVYEEDIRDLAKSDESVLEDFGKDEKKLLRGFLGNRFYYIGKYPSNINEHIKNSESSNEDNSLASLTSNLSAFFSYFDLYADFTPETIDGGQKSYFKNMIDNLSKTITSIHNDDSISNTYKQKKRRVFTTDEDGQSYSEEQFYFVNDKNEEITEEQLQTLENDYKQNTIIPNAEKELEAFDTRLAAIVESFSLTKSLVLSSFVGTLNMVKGLLKLNNRTIISSVAAARDNIEKGVKRQKSTLKSIEKFISEYINTKLYIKDYTLTKFKDSIKKFCDNAFRYKKRDWFKGIKDLKETDDYKLPTFIGTRYNEPDATYLKYVSFFDKISEIYSKPVTEKTNKEIEKLSNEVEEYDGEINNNKSNKNNNNDEEKGDSSTPLNDSYIIRRGDRVYDSSYLHQIVKGRFNVSRNTTLNESNRKTKVLKHQWDQAYNFLNEAVNNLPIRRKFRY